MKKLLSVILMVSMVFALCGCMYVEDHFTLNEDGSGNLYSCYDRGSREHNG